MAQRYLNVAVRLQDQAAKVGLQNLGISGGNIMSGLGVAAAGAATAVAGIGMAGIKASLELDAKMGEVQTLLAKELSLEDSTERIRKLRTNVQDLAMATGMSTADMAQGLYDVISALGDTDEAMTVLEIAGKAAAAGVGDTGSTVKLLTGIAKAYNDTSPEMIQHLADLSFETVRLGVTTLPEMAASMGKAAQSGAAMGVPVDELFATLAAFSGQGRDTSEVITTMEAAMRTALNPNKELTDAMVAMDEKSAQAALSSKGLAIYLRDVADYAEKTETPLGELTGRAEATALTLQFAGDQFGTFLEKQQAMLDSAGAGERAWDRMAKGIAGNEHRLKILDQSWSVILQRIGDLILNEGPQGTSMLDDISRSLGDMAEALADPNSELSTMISEFRELVGLIMDTVSAISDFTGGVRDFADNNMWLIDPLGLSWGNIRNDVPDVGPATQAYLAGNGGQYTPHSERGTSGVMHVIVDNADTGSMGLLEAISG